jgi:hypothetical protein
MKTLGDCRARLSTAIELHETGLAMMRQKTKREAGVRARISWAMLGGLAVSIRTEPRFTRDVDLAVAVAADDEAERLARCEARRAGCPRSTGPL